MVGCGKVVVFVSKISNYSTLSYITYYRTSKNNKESLIFGTNIALKRLKERE